MAPAPFILVVTADADSACVYECWLGHLGYEVHTVTDPDDAFRVALSLRPDPIVTNFPTPLASGGTLTARVRATRELAPTPLLDVTTHGLPAEVAMAAAAGASATLPMPTPLEDLAGADRRLIGPPHA